MKTRHLYTNSGPGGSGARDPGFSCEWFAKRCLSAIGFGFLAIAASSALAHDHGGNPGDHSQQEPSRWRVDYRHNYYRDPFWGSWYPGYSGVYDSDYWYIPTPEQKAAAQKQVQLYLAAVKKGRKHAASHRYIAVQTLHPNEEAAPGLHEQACGCQVSSGEWCNQAIGPLGRTRKIAVHDGFRYSIQAICWFRLLRGSFHSTCWDNRKV